MVSSCDFAPSARPALSYYQRLVPELPIMSKSSPPSKSRNEARRIFSSHKGKTQRGSILINLADSHSIQSRSGGDHQQGGKAFTLSRPILLHTLRFWEPIKSVNCIVFSRFCMRVLVQQHQPVLLPVQPKDLKAAYQPVAGRSKSRTSRQ